MAGERTGSGPGSRSKITADQVRQQMTEYLTKKFEKDFVVERVVRTGNEGFGYNKFVGKAYPKDDPTMRFGVAWDVGTPGEYYDNYLSKLWSIQGKAEIAATLKEVYGKEIALQYKISLNKAELQGLSHSEVIGKYGNESVLNLSYFVFISGVVDRKTEAERVFKIFKRHVMDNKIEHYFVTAYYFTKEFENQFMKSFSDPEKFGKEFDSDRLHDAHKLVDKVQINNMTRPVRKIDDIISIFSY